MTGVQTHQLLLLSCPSPGCMGIYQQRAAFPAPQNPGTRMTISKACCIVSASSMARISHTSRKRGPTWLTQPDWWRIYPLLAEIKYPHCDSRSPCAKAIRVAPISFDEAGLDQVTPGPWSRKTQSRGADCLRCFLKKKNLEHVLTRKKKHYCQT